jgi:hypothetical protein
MRLVMTVRALQRSGAMVRVSIRDGEKHWHLGNSTALPVAMVEQQLIPAYRTMANAQGWTFTIKREATDRLAGGMTDG